MFTLTRTLSKKLVRGIDTVFYNRTAKKDQAVDETEKQVTRYKPEGLDALCRTTKFSRKELQIMYRGFKNQTEFDVLSANVGPIYAHVDGFHHLMKQGSTECPSGVVNEDTFKYIYSQFFPQGDCTSYAHYVFNTFDQDRSGTISFEVLYTLEKGNGSIQDSYMPENGQRVISYHYQLSAHVEFVLGLSLLLRGTLQEKLEWTFNLYDINGDGVITSDEMYSIVLAVYDIVGKYAEPKIEEHTIREHVDNVFRKMDTNKDGVITLDEFIESCRRDVEISRSMNVFDTVL